MTIASETRVRKVAAARREVLEAFRATHQTGALFYSLTQRRIARECERMVLSAARSNAIGPVFLDYLYVAFTNASAFSPTDAMPLSVRMKSLKLGPRTTQ